MALRRNSLVLGLLALALTAAPAAAEEANYMSRSDFVRLETGDAPQSNITIQSPTPWPAYVNNTRIRTPARQGISALEQMYKRYEGDSNSAPSTVINIGK